MAAVRLVDGQWVYLPFRSLGSVDWRPVALIDRRTGRVYALVPWLTNEAAAALVWGS